MSVEVYCIYTTDNCTHGLTSSDYCDQDFNGYITCDCYIPKDNRIGATCLSYKAREALIHRKYKAVEYEENDGLSIGKEFIPSSNIIFLSIDGNIFIDEREGETMKKELTFGEVAELLKKFEAEHPGAEKTELIAYAYEAGYKAGQSEKGAK